MTLERFGIRGKLILLLALPLTAVMFVAALFLIDRLGSAQSAATTAEVARDARQLGTLVLELQRERLITAGYLASPVADRVDLLIQQQVVIDTSAAVRAELGSHSSADIIGALTRVGSLKDLRGNVIRRGVTADSVVQMFHAIIESVINSLRLTVQRGTDAEGARQLAALDALLRATEQSTLRAMALVASATTPEASTGLLVSSSEQFHLYAERFVQQASRTQSALVVQLDQGETARRLDALIDRLPVARSGSERTGFYSDVLAVARVQAGLRRMVLERVTAEIADAAAVRASGAERAAWTVGFGAAALFAAVVGLAIVVSRSIADPLRRLTVAATTTADLANAELIRVADVEGVDEEPPRLATISVASGHEMGALAAAFNRVQATAAMLLERQLVSRRNVGLMFANVAQRTQNLVMRQLALVDKLERDEQNSQILAGLYQIDHVSTRLRRTSENLLVIAGARNYAKLGGPATLAAIVRSSLAEIEDYGRVRFDDPCDVVIAPALVSDLVLVFAELLENATAFSPPNSVVVVRATQAPNQSCVVEVIDYGIGMEPERIAEENRRLVERERLDVAPTSMLGLFVVGRLARRHGLHVTLAATPTGGVTATVQMPPTVVITAAPPIGATPVRAPTMWAAEGPGAAHPSAAQSSAADAAHSEVPGPFAIVPDSPDAFSWFSVETASESVIPGPQPEPTGRGAASTTTPAVRPHGLARRVPGANLAPGLPERKAIAEPRGTDRWHPRDAEASRAAFDGYASGLLRAAAQSPARDLDATTSVNPIDEGEHE